MSAAASGFDEPSLYVPGLALLLLGVGSWLWVGLSAQGASITRIPGPPTVEEESPYPVRLILGKGVVPPPGGEEPLPPVRLSRGRGVAPPPGGGLEEPLLGHAIRLTRNTPQRVRLDV